MAAYWEKNSFVPLSMPAPLRRVMLAVALGPHTHPVAGREHWTLSMSVRVAGALGSLPRVLMSFVNYVGDGGAECAAGEEHA